MKFLKQFIIAFVVSCVLAAGAMADEPQKNDNQKPPPKQPQEVRKPDKPPPPPPRDNGNKGSNDGKRGKP